MRVALVVMPFAAADRPSLAVGLLQAALRQRQIECDSKYFNMTMQSLLGMETYCYLSHLAPPLVMAGQWAFSQVMYGQQHSCWESYMKEVLDDPTWGMAEPFRQPIYDLIEAAPLLLRLAYESNDWSRYDLVGFSCSFEQTMPALCLASLIRKHHPDVLLAVGGANFEQIMGRPYLEQYSFLDFVSTGEADRSFPQLCCNLRDLKEGRITTLEVPPGFVYRRNGEVHESPQSDAEPVQLEDLPTPSYEDFFRVAEKTGQFSAREQWLPVEASRGCWWGEKNQCSFCGLNGEKLGYRNKSWQRVVAEARELSDRYGAVRIQYTDNSLGMGYFKDLIPHWAEQQEPTEKYFEIRANLNREQLQMLRQAGVSRVQPGIENLIDSTLQKMRKGVTAAQNLAVIRWSVEVGLVPLWNIIFGFPGEPLEGYKQTGELLRRITHLPPPAVIGPIRMDRFSPHFNQWQEYGFSYRRPVPAYRHVFPFEDEVLDRIAYYFDYDHLQFADAVKACKRLTEQCYPWQEKTCLEENGELALKSRQGSMVLVDTRFNRLPSTLRLTAAELALLVACDAPTSREKALRSATGQATSSELSEALERLIKRSVVAEVGERLLTLALLPPREQLTAVQP
jgi:ribosomal peptide maturation radical SAM protein 1